MNIRNPLYDYPFTDYIGIAPDVSLTTRMQLQRLVDSLNILNTNGGRLVLVDDQLSNKDKIFSISSSEGLHYLNTCNSESLCQIHNDGGLADLLFALIAPWFLGNLVSTDKLDFMNIISSAESIGVRKHRHNNHIPFYVLCDGLNESVIYSIYLTEPLSNVSELAEIASHFESRLHSCGIISVRNISHNSQVSSATHR